MCLNPALAPRDKPLPLYICSDCADVLKKEHSDYMMDILLPMSHVSIKCENKVGYLSLSLYLSLYLSIYLSIYLSFFYLSIYLSVYLSIYLSIYLSVSVSLSFCPPIASFSLFLHVCLCVPLSLHYSALSFGLSLFPSLFILCSYFSVCVTICFSPFPFPSSLSI